MQERHNVFGKKKKHEFIWLSSITKMTPPSPMDKALLIRAGLGPRELSLFEYGESFEFHDSIMSALPRLSEGGGYELLHTKQNYVSSHHHLEGTLLIIWRIWSVRQRYILVQYRTYQWRHLLKKMMKPTCEVSRYELVLNATLTLDFPLYSPYNKVLSF